MAGREVIWADAAKADAYRILEYWNERNSSGSFSKKLLSEFDEAARQISQHPRIGKNTDVEGVRYIMVRDYAITYHVTEKIIHIVSVWDERRDPEKKPI